MSFDNLPPGVTYNHREFRSGRRGSGRRKDYDDIKEERLDAESDRL